MVIYVNYERLQDETLPQNINENNNALFQFANHACWTGEHNLELPNDVS